MVRLGCVPGQGGLSAYMENAKATRTTPPGRQEQTDDLGKDGPEATAVKSNDNAYRNQAVWSQIESADDRREQTIRMLEQLKRQYPGIVSHLAWEKDAGDLAALAVRAGTGVHLYLPREFVGRMGSSRESFSQCWSELVSAAGTLLAKQGQIRAVGTSLREEGISCWSVQDKTKKEVVSVVSRTDAKGTPSAGSNPRVRVSVPLSVSSYFSRVARVCTKSQVQEAVWDIYRSISNLKRAVARGDDQQRVKTPGALRPLQKLLGRSGRKMRKLERERLKAQEQKKAEKEHRDRQAFQLRQERRRMRLARLGPDADLVKEDHRDDLYIQAYRQSSGTAYKWEHQMPAGTMASFFGAVPSGGSGVVDAAEARFTVADVIVSGDTL